MPGTIADDQNAEGNLKHFAASRVWYKRGRRVAFVQVAFAFATPLASAVVLWYSLSNLKIWVTAAAITAALLDTIVLDPLQRSLRGKGANEQEVFDCEVLDLPWPSGLASRPSQARTNDAARKVDLARHRNWYPDVSAAPRWLGALICQQCSSWWDAKLRRNYINMLICLLSAAILGLSGLSLYKKLSFDLVITTIYAPLLPLINWAIREIMRHRETERLSSRTEEQAAATWDRALKGEVQDCKAAIREVQDAIYYRRRTNPFVPDLLQRIQQAGYREIMDKTAAEMTAKAAATVATRPEIGNCAGA